MIDSSILYTQLQQLIFLACEFKVDCKVSCKGFKLSYVQILVRIHGLSQVKINNCVRVISSERSHVTYFVEQERSLSY